MEVEEYLRGVAEEAAEIPDVIVSERSEAQLQADESQLVKVFARVGCVNREEEGESEELAGEELKVTTTSDVVSGDGDAERGDGWWRDDWKHAFVKEFEAVRRRVDDRRAEVQFEELATECVDDVANDDDDDDQHLFQKLRRSEAATASRATIQCLLCSNQLAVQHALEQYAAHLRNAVRRFRQPPPSQHNHENSEAPNTTATASPLLERVRKLLIDSEGARWIFTLSLLIERPLSAGTAAAYSSLRASLTTLQTQLLPSQDDQLIIAADLLIAVCVDVFGQRSI